jgi:protein-S-isoprenylcysteine O-methyltransferase Ste14
LSSTDVKKDLVTAKRTRTDIIWSILLTVLGIACFPVNPLVLTGVIEVKQYLPLEIIAWVVLALSLVLVFAPIVMFPRRGGVPKGKSFVQTTRMVDTGIYAIVRHPQYSGGIYAIFLTNFLLYPHWLFAMLGVAGTIVTYLGCVEEDKLLVKKFGDDYWEYMQRVPRTNFWLGIIRLSRRRKEDGGVV